MSLDNAPDEVKLAVDLIMLLEQHQIPTDTALAALEIVREDFLRKQREAQTPPPALKTGWSAAANRRFCPNRASLPLAHRLFRYADALQAG